MLPLSTTMQINAISSGATGAVLIMFAKPVASIFGVTQTAPFICIGIFLVLFAALVFIVSKKQPINTQAVRFIVLLDVLWVITSLFAIIFLFSTITSIGNMVIAVVAVWVAGMAYLQSKGFKLYTANEIKTLVSAIFYISLLGNSAFSPNNYT